MSFLSKLFGKTPKAAKAHDRVPKAIPINPRLVTAVEIAFIGDSFEEQEKVYLENNRGALAQLFLPYLFAEVAEASPAAALVISFHPTSKSAMASSTSNAKSSIVIQPRAITAKNPVTGQTRYYDI